MIEVRIGDSRRLIHGLTDKSIDCVVTSPPYWGLRDYKTEPIIFDGLPDCEHDFSIEMLVSQSGGINSISGNGKSQPHHEAKTNFCSKCGAWRGQLGLEPTPELYLKHLLYFFDDVRLKLKDEGNIFINLGDTYNTNGNVGRADKSKYGGKSGIYCLRGGTNSLPAKCLCMIPQRFAWGMIERGWILRNEIIWAKPNHMPESVTDRLTKAHEVIYHFVKQGKYYYNLDAIREKHVRDWTGCGGNLAGKGKHKLGNGFKDIGNRNDLVPNPLGKNPGDVWTITTQPYPESHFAVFPLELVRRPILAGCPVGGTVLDPFAGSGTVGEFCRYNDRNAILFELNPEYKKLIEDRAMLNVPELSEWCSSMEDA